MSKIRKIVIRILKWTLATILSIFILLIILGAIFQERVVNWIVTDLQSELAIPLQVEKIKFSLIENFPNASAVLENSLALYPGYQNRDTLLTVKRFYINLNLISLIQGKISVRSIDISHATITIIAQPDGTFPKISIFKKTSGSITATFKIRSIEADNLLLIYTNRAENNYQRVAIRNCTFSGTISEQLLAGRIKINIQELQTNNYSDYNALGENATIDISGNYYYGNKVTIDKFLYTSKYLSINGIYSLSLTNELSGYFRFSVNLPNEEILHRVFHSNQSLSITSLDNAAVDVSGRIIGPKIFDVDFDASTALSGANLLLFNDVQIENINSRISFKASIRKNTLQPKLITLEPTTFSLQNKDIVVSLNFLPQQHQLTAKINGDISPSNFSKLFKISSPEISGDNIRLDASLASNDFSIGNFNPDRLTVQGTVDLSNLIVVLPTLTLKNISGSLGISETLEFKNLSLDGSLGKMDVSGTIPHWRQSFFSAENRLPLEIKGNLSSPDLNLNLPEWGISEEDPTATNKTDSTQTPLIISKIEVNFSAKKIALRQLRGSDARGTLVYLPGTSFSLNNTSLLTSGGKASFNLENRLVNNDNTINFSGTVHGIFVDSLFKAFGNFDQTFIGYEHLSGKISADIKLRGVYENGKLLNSKLYCLSNLEITEGSLRNYEPLKKLSGFVNLKELEKINFKRLKNTIRIENGEIVIPEMLIENNALNINLSGVHKLSGSFDYRMRIKLKDLLWAKNKSENRFRNDLGIVEQEESDGGSIFIKLIGTPDNYSFKYDKDRAIETLGKRLKQEGAAMRDIFKQDKAITKSQPDGKKNSGFIISDPLENKEKGPTTDTTKTKPLKKNSGFKIDWE